MSYAFLLVSRSQLHTQVTHKLVLGLFLTATQAYSIRIDKALAEAVYYFLSRKISVIVCGGCFKYRLWEGIAICLVTSCPDAVNLTANRYSLVFLFFLLSSTSPRSNPSTTLSIAVRDSAWQPRL
jgi:hypothetical protein